MDGVIGCGAGGHAKVVMEILQLIGEYKLIGLLDPKKALWGTRVSTVPVLGDDSLLYALYDQGIRFAFIGLGTVGQTGTRRRLYEKVLQYKFQIVSAIHPQSIVSPSVEIGCGPTIMASAVVNPGAKLGNNVIINTGAIIEHDCEIYDHVHIATGARLAGAVVIGEGAHIGVGASIRQGVRIGRNAIVGAGAVVIKDIPDDVIVVGVPARPLHEVKAKSE